MSRRLIDPSPALDAEGLRYFKEVLQRSACYLEYGSGGSTVYAGRVAKVGTIISVESDVEWVEQVQQSLVGSASNLMIRHCDIGEVGSWGVPKNQEKIGNFWSYMTTPWMLAHDGGHVPDAILIDGRFRVASFLYSLLVSRLGTIIMFDDYLNRPQYFVVEQFCRLRETHGRMGVFQADQSYSMDRLVARIAQYSIVWS